MQENYRKLLTYSYNIVGSYEDAKDLVQDIIEKYISLDKSTIRDESNFLIKSIINHSINFKKRQNKKDTYGQWLPEPISFDQADTNLIREQTAGYTMLVLFENLNPKERAVFILKKGFDYSHEEIAELLNISHDNSRQLFSRANKALKAKNFIEPRQAKVQSEVLKKYQEVLGQANVSELEALLVADIKLTADGGKNIQVIKAVEIGIANTIRLLTFIQQQYLHDKRYSFHNFNHQPALCFWEHDKLHNCQILDVDTNGKIQNIYSIVDPVKLKKLQLLSHS